MNKLFSKIAGLSIGLAMAIGVGVAVASNSEATPVDAAVSTRYTLNTASTTIATSNSYANYTETSTGYKWTITLGSKQTGSPAGLWLGSNSGQKAKYILSNGNYSEATAIASAIGVTTSATYHAALFQQAGGTAIANVDTVVLTYGATGNTAPSKAWVVYSTNNGTSWTVFDEVKTSLSSSGVTFSDDNVSSAIWGLVIYGSNYGTMRVPVLTFKGTDATTQTITTDPASGEAYTDESISLTTNASSASWALSNNTCGASLSAASGKTVSVSATSAGSVRVTATASGYTSPYVDLTFIEKPTSPFITPEKASASGYTGQNETISFTYGNLTGSLGVTSSNTSVVTVGSPSYDAGEGTVQFNYVGAGSTTVKFKDGSTELASVNVTVTASSVSITGMPSAKSIATGATLDLGSLITVTPTGNLSSDVTWSTDNSSIAGVTQTGLVTGAGAGSTTITVTPDDYPAGAVSCTVTVANVLSAVFGTTGSSSSTEVTDGSKYKTDYSYTIDANITLGNISKVYPQTSNALKFGSSSVVGSMTFSIPSTIDSKPVYITNVTVRAVRYNETKSTTMLIGGVEKALTYSADDYTADLSSGEVTSFVLTADSSSSDKRMYVQSVSIQYAFKKTLSSIALSGSYQTTFTKGGTFNHDGLVVTATYSDSSTVDVTSSATFSGYDLSNVGNQTVTVSYTEGTTKTATYSITVSYAAVTSVTLSQNSAEIGLNETFNYTLVTVTVSPDNANKEVAWSVSASTVGTDYDFDESGLLSGDTEGTITLKCESVADSSKYDELVVTVTGDPTAEFTPASVSGYVGKSDDIAFTYGNMSDTSLISITSSNSSIAEVDEFVADEGEGLVTVNFVAAGSTTLSISYDGGSTLDSITVTVSTDSVTALTWSAPTIKVYSGATTTASDASSWNVHYTMASGDYGSLVYGEYTLKLGGSSITLPHIWDASEDGKVLSIEYGGFASPTTSTVDVTQSLQAVNKPNEGDSYYQLVSTDADLEAGRYLIVSIEDAKAFDGSLDTLDAGRNNFDVTISDGTVIANDSTASGKYFDLTVENDAWTITSASGANVGHSASGNGMNGTGTNTITVSNGISTILGTGGKGLAYNSASGSSSERFRYYTSPAANANHSVSLFKLVTEEGEGSTNIANVAGHEAAQKAVVAFAKAMNAAFDNTANCTDGVADAWTTASSAYSSNITNNASLSADEKAYAKNLIKYASAQYTDDTDNDYSYCLERAMATYEACIQKHGQIAFMSDVRPVSASSRITPLSIVNGNGNTVAIIVIVSMISVAAIGGYFFFRRKKKNNNI